MVNTIAPMIPAFLIAPARVGAKQHAAGLERGMQLLQHAR